MRRILDPDGGPRGASAVKTPASQEVDILATLSKKSRVRNIRDIMRPRRGAAKLSTVADHEGKTATPPYDPFSEPAFRAPPWAPSELRHKSAAEAGKLAASKQSTRPLSEYRVASAKMPPLRDSKSSGRNVEPHRRNSGDAHPALTMELSITQKTEVGCRHGKLRRVAWARPARGRRNMGL